MQRTCLIARTTLALLSLALVAASQQALGDLTLTLDDGSVLPGASIGTRQMSQGSITYGIRTLVPGGHYRAWVRNDSPPALPDGTGGHLPNVPLLIRSATVRVPNGWRILDADYVGAKQDNTVGKSTTWTLIGERTRRPVHSRYPKESARSHFVDGGHQLWWDILAPGHPALRPVADSDLEGRIRTFLGMGPQPLEQSALPSRLQALKRVWAIDRGPGRYGLDDWVMRRFQDRIPWRGTPAWWGCVQWGDRWCNHHYDMISHAIEAHLYGVKGAWLAASRMARKHLQTGIYDSSGHIFSSMHVYEKTGGLGQYPGDNVRPVDSHEWDTGLICWALLSRDPMAMEMLQRRAQVLSSWPPSLIWNGAGGVRQLGWTLRNMRAFTWFGIRDMRAEMAALITHAIQVNNGVRWWRNQYTPKSFAPWMQGLTNVEIVAALEGPLSAHPQQAAWMKHVREKVTFQLEHVIKYDAESETVVIPHQVEDFDAGRNTVRYQATQLAWAIPQLALARRWGLPQAEAMLSAAKAGFLSGSRPYNESGAVGGGPASLKTWASAHQWAARENLWR